jgi:predicted nucleic acid-binding protein
MVALGEGVYWDACIFYALLKGEEHRNGELDSIKRQAALFDNGRLFIVTSAITLTEVLPSKLSEKEIGNFNLMNTRANFLWVDVNPRVASLAVDLRNEFTKTASESEKEMRLGTPDAIHVASAISSGVKKLITLDCNDKPKLYEVSLMTFSDEILSKYGLTTMRPDIKGQVELDIS